MPLFDIGILGEAQAPPAEFPGGTGPLKPPVHPKVPASPAAASAVAGSQDSPPAAAAADLSADPDLGTESSGADGSADTDVNKSADADADPSSNGSASADPDADLGADPDADLGADADGSADPEMDGSAMSPDPAADALAKTQEKLQRAELYDKIEDSEASCRELRSAAEVLVDKANTKERRAEAKKIMDLMAEAERQCGMVRENLGGLGMDNARRVQATVLERISAAAAALKHVIDGDGDFCSDAARPNQP
jgi:hypothetical protein